MSIGRRYFYLLFAAAVLLAPRLAFAGEQTLAGTVVTLPGDARHTLWIPADYAPRDGRIDLLVHFHGGASLIRQAAAEARRPWVVATVEYHGFSSVYRKPFSMDRARFARLLDEALQAARATEAIEVDATIGKLVVSSFSAGFGAVREVLKSPEYFAQIDGIVLIDSLYAGYVGDGTDGVVIGEVDPGLMKDFGRFAEASAAGRKAMIVTHTEVPTDGYANTRETADYLLDKLGLPATAVDRRLPRPASAGDQTRALRIRRHAQRGGFAIYGTNGRDAAEHVSHLRHLAVWLDELDVQ